MLVIGATGVAGGAGIRAARQCFGDSVHITGVWFGKPNPELSVPGTDLTLFGDISDPSTYRLITERNGSAYDWCLYATALGEVGFPIEEATPEQIAESNRLSFDPLLELERRLELKAIVAYSTFFTLEHQRITYGAMGHSKARIEQWALEQGKARRICLRAGAFRSASSQGIKLLVRRRAKQLAESDNELLRRYFAGAKPSEAVEAMERAVFEEERLTYGDTGTDERGLEAAHIEIFSGTSEPFVNVCGTRVWLSDEPQRLQ